VINRRPVKTDRLHLEPIEARHAAPLWEATEGSLGVLARWLPWAPTASPEATRAFTEEVERDWDEGTNFQFVIHDSDGVVGAMGLDVPVPIRRLGEMGYWIRSERTGRGYATEAGAAVVRFGFETLGLYRIELRAGTENLASQRVAHKLGFVREGVLRRGCPMGDDGYDCYLYGLLASDPGGWAE
jgi:ribosomal-protein-serine acetyltransferase